MPKKPAKPSPAQPIVPPAPAIRATGGAALAPEIEQIADVVVDVTNGGFLRYRIDVQGANPNFTFSCKKRNMINRAADFPGHPKSTYQWEFLNHAGDVDEQPVDVFVITMLFIAAKRYTLTITHQTPAGTEEPVRKRTFESNDPTHIQQSTLVVAIK